ncbi:MAG: MGH1-like glycoside hydrolase domain-containing protein [Actinomycetota bacterium]
MDDVRSARLVHRPGDMFNPPGLTNRIGCVQAVVDPVATRSLSFPPFGSGDVATGWLFLNGHYFPATGARMGFTWRPDRIERDAEWDGWRVRTITVMPPNTRAVLVRVEIENATGAERELEVKLGLRGGMTHKPSAWVAPLPPMSVDHDVTVDPATNSVIFRDRTSVACAVQGGSPRPDDVSVAALTWRRQLPAGERFVVDFVHTVGDREDDAMRAFGSVHGASAIEAARADWNAELAAVFTPGNDRYEGSLPVLETSDEDIRRAWLSGILGVVYFRRESPMFGRTYDTLMPRYWQTVTFLWDYSLSSTLHALLDPGVMRRHLEHWMLTDIHGCFGTEWLTGKAVGDWYSVNDYAMTKMGADYLRWGGDERWLDSEVGGRAVADRLHDFATNWEGFRTSSGLAAYGGIGNLLECVSTYVHEIAALNAGNVWSMRFVADLAERRGDSAAAHSLRERASALVGEIQHLYGDGWWHTRSPDGNLIPVKHCYDFITLLTTIDDDLGEKQLSEMVDFFRRELHTPTWMRALSSFDPDAMFDIRPDHQWTGAYPAWPPLGVLGLFRAGEHELAVDWLRGLGRSGNQGPYGQAHFVETFAEPDAGGALKAPSDIPYITDWSVSSGGAWVQAIVEGLFGVDAGLDGIRAAPRFASFEGRLTNLPYRGRLYDVDAAGLHESGA